MLFIGLAIVLSIIYKSGENLNKQLQAFQNSLHQKERDVNALLENISHKNLSDFLVRNSFFYDKSLISFCQKKDIIIAVYYNDTLIFWSDNVIPLIEISDDAQNSEGIKHFSNGWFELLRTEKDQFVYLGLIKIKNDYKYQNEYLVNEFQKDFKIDPEIKINLQKETYNVYSSEDIFLFSLDLKQRQFLNETKLLWLFVLFLLGFLFFIGFMYHFYKDFPLFNNKPKLFILVFIIDLLILRYLLFYFKM